MKFNQSVLLVGASAAIASVAIGVAPAGALTLTSGGNTYEVTTVRGTFGNLGDLLASQPWWDNSDLAEALATQAENQLGLPNIPENGGLEQEGPYFAFKLGFKGKIAAWNWDGNDTPPGVEVDTANNSFTGDYVWAIVEQPTTAVPTPALLPAMIGFGASLVRRRKQAAATNA